MFFNDHVSKEISRYGVGTTTSEGRYHLLASFEETGGVQMLCQSCRKKIGDHPDRSIRWFKEESRAVQVLRSNKKACQKCLRTIETVELSLEPVA